MPSVNRVGKAAYAGRLPSRITRNSDLARPVLPCVRMHGVEKRIVYILRSLADRHRHYVGITNDLAGRLRWHNEGPCGHTRHHRPWSVLVSMEFSTEDAAVRFEKYLKSGSGRAFATRHFT